VTTVQPSESVLRLVSAEVDHRFDREGHAGFDFSPVPLRPKFGISGGSCIEAPTPWPTMSRTTLKPFARLLLDRRGDVADAIPDDCGRNAEVERLARDAESFRRQAKRCRREQ